MTELDWTGRIGLWRLDAILTCFHLEVFIWLQAKLQDRMGNWWQWLQHRKTSFNSQQLSCHLPRLNADLVNGEGEREPSGGCLQTEQTNIKSKKKKKKTKHKKKAQSPDGELTLKKCPLCSGALHLVLFNFYAFIYSCLYFCSFEHFFISL